MTLQSTSESQYIDVDIDIDDLWYQPYASREHAEFELRKINKPGAFLVRSARGKGDDVILSVMQPNAEGELRAHHITIKSNANGNLLWSEQVQFHNIRDMIDHLCDIIEAPLTVTLLK